MVVLRNIQAFGLGDTRICKPFIISNTFDLGHLFISGYLYWIGQLHKVFHPGARYPGWNTSCNCMGYLYKTSTQDTRTSIQQVQVVGQQLSSIQVVQ